MTRIPKRPASIGPKRAIAYDRVSTVVQSKVGYSGGEDGYQLADCRAHIDRKGYVYLDALTDADSGKNWRNPGILEAIDRAKRGEYDVLVVAYSGRFARNLGKQEVYEAELARYGVEVEFLDLPVSRKDPGGKAMRQMFGVWAEYEGELIAHRTSNGRIQKAKQGKVVGSGTAPYGHRYLTVWVEQKGKHVPYGLELNPETSEVVVRIYRDIIEESAITIAGRLTAEGVPMPGTWTPSETRPRPTVWAPSTVRDIVKNSVHRGLWRYGEEAVTLDYQLVDDATWHAANRALGSHSRKRQTRHPERISRAEQYVLRGRLVCDGCGGAISTDDRQVTGSGAAHWPDGRTRRYLCARSVPSKARRMGMPVCALPGLLAADERLGGRNGGRLVGVEDLAWRFVRNLYTRPGELEARLAELDARTDEATADYARRLEHLDRQIAEQRQIVAGAEREKYKLAEDDPRYPLHEAASAAAAEVWKRLSASRASLAGTGGPGIPAEHRRLVLAQAAYVRRQLGRHGSAVSPGPTIAAEYAALRLEGRVRPDPDGERVGRDGRVSIEWSVFVSVDNEQSFLKLRCLSTSAGVAVLGLEPVASVA